MEAAVLVEKKVENQVHVISINRPQKRNAVDRETASYLLQAFQRFEADDEAKVAILTSVGSSFCAGADLDSVSKSDNGMNVLEDIGCDNGPMGPTRLRLTKPVIAAVKGYAVAGGLELACWCSLRVASRDAVFGVFCRRFGVPLIDGGTVRLPKLIGHSRAMDMILTGRPIDAETAFNWGLVNRIVDHPEQLLEESMNLARQLCSFPQKCMRSDYMSATEASFGCDYYDQEVSQNTCTGLLNEFRRGMQVINSGETQQGSTRFAKGKQGRGGSFALNSKL